MHGCPKREVLSDIDASCSQIMKFSFLTLNITYRFIKKPSILNKLEYLSIEVSFPVIQLTHFSVLYSPAACVRLYPRWYWSKLNNFQDYLRNDNN